MIRLASAGTADVEFTLTVGDHVAVYGFDPERGGAYAETTWCGVIVTYDASDGAGDDPVLGVLRFLGTFGFVDLHAVDETRAWLTTPSCWRSSKPPRRVRRVLALIERLGDGGTS